MKLRDIDPPRAFRVGDDRDARIARTSNLDADEQVTFTALRAREFDVARKSWGYYATPSLNRRLPDHGLRAALTANADGRIALLLVESRAGSRLRRLLRRAVDPRGRLARYG